MTARYANDAQNAPQITVRENQIKSIRYKVYVFFLGLFMFVFWPTFIQAIEGVRGKGAFSIDITNPVHSMLYATGEAGLLNELYIVEQDVVATEEKIRMSMIEKEVVKQLSNPKKINTLVNCINFQICDEVPSELMGSMNLLRTYLIINQLQAKKMKFNQKLLLRNLNEFLLRTQGGVLNGSLLSINFSEPVTVNPELSLYSLPMTLKIEFDHKKMLMTFLENLEYRVNLELPVMFVINSISYDIVNYQETQVVDISLEVYFYESNLRPEDFEAGEMIVNDAQQAPTDEALLDDLRNFGNESQNDASNSGQTVPSIITGAQENTQAAGEIEETVIPSPQGFPSRAVTVPASENESE